MGLQPELAGIPQPRLNIAWRPIANKYCEGKLKSTLRRELKDVKSLGVKGLMDSPSGWSFGAIPSQGVFSESNVAFGSARGLRAALVTRCAMAILETRHKGFGDQRYMFHALLCMWRLRLKHREVLWSVVEIKLPEILAMRDFNPPVLKHGPRSPTCVRA